jgi:hypothetical protein
MLFVQPPHTNGVMELLEEEKEEIRAKLIVIQEAFKETDEHPVCDTFYLTATYNAENVGNEINGDTCQMILVEEPPQESEV